MSKKIEELNEEVNLKSIQFHDLLEKYEDFEEDSSQIRTENEDKIKVIKESMSKERNERDLKIELLEE